MKKLNLIFGMLLVGMFAITSISNSVIANEEEKVKGPKLEYKAENNRVDLGTLYVDELERMSLEIEFENAGTEPLTLSRVTACCGTRVEDYPEEPINPGELGVIKVSFNLARRPHNVNRVVRAMSNDPDGQKILRITGKVEEKEE